MSNAAEEKNTPDPKRWKILYVLVLVVFLTNLDNSIINIALPTLTGEFNVPVSSVTWVATSYLITICALLLFFGRLGDIKGNTKILKFGVVVFAIGTLLCGISVNFMMLTISRVIQGIGAAASMATNQAIISQTFPESERGRALGINVGSVALGSLLGPPLGGFILTAFSWRYIFLLRFPISIIVFLLGNRVLPKRSAINEKLDMKGFALYASSVILIFCAIGIGDTIDFSNPFVTVPIIIGLFLLAMFIIVERKHSQPMLDLTIFKNTLFSVSIVCVFLVFVAMKSINIIQPFYLQSARGMTTLTAGLLTMIYPVTVALVSPFAGYLSDKVDKRIPTLVGLSISTTAYVGAALMTEHTSLVYTGVIYVLLGFGFALFQSPNTSLIMSSVPQNKLGLAGSVNALVRNAGHAVGALLCTVILFSSMSSLYGQPVNDYVQGRPDLFIHGMRTTYLVFAGCSLAGALLTAFRLFSLKTIKRS